ncbi:hypothetical protein [Chryseobacterium sp. Leaf394]|uniref:XAC2610-related protein n=1 Tax=Chryseobacterium sp. Leaf394 TaxID=1736361 RepID=UPI00070221BB|nr:hypothetical protein [Chryseobacterium sp. Leaf394]KQS91346.1 hypothetical protein ASG21_02370 [Chryseobacterium sp. Leaf394]
MKNTVLLIALLLIFSCQKDEKSKTVEPVIKIDSREIAKEKIVKLSDEEILKIQEEEEIKRSQIVRKYTVSKKGNGFEYKVFCEEQKSGLINFPKIEVLKSGKLFQKLETEKDSTLVLHDYEVSFSCDEDWNFDGSKDFKLIKWVGMVDQSYYLWLFDEKSGKYIFSPSFSKIINPVANLKSKEITSSYHAGPTTFYYSTYQFKKGKFIKTHFEVEGEED